MRALSSLSAALASVSVGLYKPEFESLNPKQLHHKAQTGFIQNRKGRKITNEEKKAVGAWVSISRCGSRVRGAAANRLLLQLIAFK